MIKKSYMIKLSNNGIPKHACMHGNYGIYPHEAIEHDTKGFRQLIVLEDMAKDKCTNVTKLQLKLNHTGH